MPASVRTHLFAAGISGADTVVGGDVGRHDERNARGMPTVPIKAASTEGRRWSRRAVVPESWASLAIAVMWLAVLADAVWGPDFVSTSGSGASTTTIPSAIFVAFFAYLGTRVVARYGFDRPRDRD
jgi:hypothetical protein